MVGSLKSIFSFLSLLLVLASAGSHRVTNADRFRNGLTPLRPRSRISRTPTRVHGRDDPAVSPPPYFNVKIVAWDISNSPEFSPRQFGDRIVPVADGAEFSYADWTDYDVYFQFLLGDIGPGPGEIHIANDNYPFLGFVSASGETDIGSGKGNYIQLAETGSSSSAGSGPLSTGDQAYAPGSSYPVESVVWSLVPGTFAPNPRSTTGEIAPQWTNADGSKPTTYVVNIRWPSGRNLFAITGDLDALQTELGPDVVITLTKLSFDTDRSQQR